jgi:alpha-glucosidase
MGEHPFVYQFSGNQLKVSSLYENVGFGQAGSTLSEVYRFVSRKNFLPNGQRPNSLSFNFPQYNTWIEPMYNPNEADIFKYAASIIDVPLERLPWFIKTK